MFFAVQFMMSKFMPNKGASNEAATDESGKVVGVAPNNAQIPPFQARPDTLSEGAVWNPVPQRIAPMWPLDTSLDVTIVVSPTFVSEPLAKVPKERKIVEETSFIYGDYDQSRVIDRTFAVPKEVQNNGTLWGHFYVGISGSILDPSIPGYDTSRAFHFLHPLTQYIPQKKVVKTKNLLVATEETEEVIFPAYMFKSF